MSSRTLLRRSPWTIIAAVVVALLLWWFTADGTEQVPDQPAARSTGQPVELDAIGPDPGGDGDGDGLETVRLSALPPEAAQVVQRIDAGGPFEHPGKDGSPFGNFEGRLPAAPRGYYREYTVPTPGLSHRGARRIVTGSEDELYWTADHYETFRRILR